MQMGVVGPLKLIGGNGWVRCGRTMELRASGCAGSCERGEAVSQLEVIILMPEKCLGAWDVCLILSSYSYPVLSGVA